MSMNKTTPALKNKLRFPLLVFFVWLSVAQIAQHQISIKYSVFKRFKRLTTL